MLQFKEVPWKSILTSIHLWAILFAHLGHSWGLSMLLTELPTYMSTVLNFDMKAVIWLIVAQEFSSLIIRLFL